MATKRSNHRKDFTQVALDVVRKATGETIMPAPSKQLGSGRKAPAKKALTLKKRAARG
jgi:hypothetical protein